MSYSIESISNDCYPGTSCLINKFDIHDEAVLSKLESDIALVKTAQLLSQPITGSFDFEHYKAIHKYLFEDLYDWAGKIRTIDITKKGTNFVKASSIERIADSAFKRLHTLNCFVGLPFEDFLENILDFYNVTNMLHPFREGNGRTQRVFFTQLIRNAGYDINFSEIDADSLMIATIQCANGVTDHLRQLFQEALVELGS